MTQNVNTNLPFKCYQNISFGSVVLIVIVIIRRCEFEYA